MKATIKDEGQGLPQPGHYVPGTDGCLWLVISIMKANEDSCVAEVDYSDWDNVEDGDVFRATASVRHG